MNSKWFANTEMKRLLEKVAESSIEAIEMNVDELKTLLVPPFKRVNDCIIISREDTNFLEKYFQNALELHMDKTGYEASSTETRINDYFEHGISMEAGTKLALLVIQIWSMQLKYLEPKTTFCFIMSSNQECVEIRFHKVRSEEKGWLSENLEGYKDGAIGYIYI